SLQPNRRSARQQPCSLPSATRSSWRDGTRGSHHPSARSPATMCSQSDHPGTGTSLRAFHFPLPRSLLRRRSYHARRNRAHHLLRFCRCSVPCLFRRRSRAGQRARGLVPACWQSYRQPELPSSCMHLLPAVLRPILRWPKISLLSLSLRNREFLTRINQIRILDLVLVRIIDAMPLACVAIDVLGDLAQRITALHGVRRAASRSGRCL